MVKKYEAWIYRVILVLLIVCAVIRIATKEVEMVGESRISAFHLTEAMTDEDGIYFSVDDKVFQYKPNNDELIELLDGEKKLVLNYMEEKKKSETYSLEGLTEITNAPGQAIARFENKLYYVTDKIARSNKFVSYDMETGEIEVLEGYHHNYGMVELIVKENCLYYTTSPHSYAKGGGLMYFNFETRENRLIYSNEKKG